MALVTSQQLNRYYDLYKTIDVTFNKDVIKATGLQTREVYLKCLGDSFPCIIYSSSMVGAKVIANVKNDLYEKIRKANNLVSLRYSFIEADSKGVPLSFFISAKITGFNPYNKENPDLNFLTLSYNQRPPDDLITILGTLLEANINSKKRKEDRILITPESMRKLGLKSKTAFLYIQGVPRKCLLRDISFSGAKVIVTGVAKFLMNREAELRIQLDERNQILNLRGVIVRFDAVEGRKDIGAVAIRFEETLIPMNFKMRINDFLVQQQKERARKST